MSAAAPPTVSAAAATIATVSAALDRAGQQARRQHREGEQRDDARFGGLHQSDAAARGQPGRLAALAQGRRAAVGDPAHESASSATSAVAAAEDRIDESAHDERQAEGQALHHREQRRQVPVEDRREDVVAAGQEQQREEGQQAGADRRAAGPVARRLQDVVEVVVAQ